MAKRSTASVDTFRREPMDAGWSMVPHGLWTTKTTPGLKALDRCILGWLWSHDAAFLEGVTLNSIRREFGTSAAVDAVERLVEHGFIEQRGDGARGGFEYVCVADPWRALCGVRTAPKPDRAETGPRRNRRADRAETGALTAPKPDHVEEQGEDHVEDQLPSGPVGPEPGSVADRKNRSAAMVKAWWDKAKDETGRAPTAVPFVGVCKIVAQLMTRFDDRDIKFGLVDAAASGTVSVGAVEMAINRRAGKQQLPARPNQAGFDADWLNDPMVNTGGPEAY